VNLANSIRNAIKIADRVKSVNGLLGTPYCDYEAVRISRVWVFGSTVKGKLQPNDTDILIELKPVGYYQGTGAQANKRNRYDIAMRGNSKADYKYRSRLGLRFQLEAKREAFKFIKKNIQNVSLHDFDNDGQLGDIPTTKIMIYPRMDLV